MDNLKRCPKCKNYKSINDFSKDSTQKSKLCVWCKACKDIIRKKWQLNNKEKKKAHEARWINKNSDRNREIKRNWYRKNKTKASEYQKKKKLENPQLYNSQRTERTMRRYARVKGCTIGNINEIKAFYKWVKTVNFLECTYCKDEIKNISDRQVDHIIPIARGGTHELINLTPSCRKCNQSKNCRSVKEFLNEISY